MISDKKDSSFYEENIHDAIARDLAKSKNRDSLKLWVSETVVRVFKDANTKYLFISSMVFEVVEHTFAWLTLKRPLLCCESDRLASDDHSLEALVWKPAVVGKPSALEEELE